MVRESYLRNSVFGFEDGFVSTIGMLAGLAASSTSRMAIIVSALVVIAVDAFSMGVGAFVTEQSAHELEGKKAPKDNLFLDSFIIWFSYMVAGGIALLPYFFDIPINIASISSIVATILGLFLVGFFKGKLVKKHPFKSGLEIVFLASMAILLGFVIGELGNRFLLDS